MGIKIFYALLGILIAGAILYLTIFCIRLPIIIGKKRNVSDENLKIISILSWVSILVGITWPIALVFSLIYKPKK